MLRLSSRAALEELSQTNKYVFHGSQNGELAQLRPTDSGSKRYNTVTGEVSTAEKCVYATADLDLAIFIATIWRRIGASGWSTNGITEDSVEFKFHASELAIKEASKPSNLGFVYVLDKNHFKRDLQNPYELISTSAVEPYALVKVTAYDLRPDFRTLTSPPEMS
jgi:hypothetical protein